MCSGTCTLHTKVVHVPTTLPTMYKLLLPVVSPCTLYKVLLPVVRFVFFYLFFFYLFFFFLFLQIFNIFSIYKIWFLSAVQNIQFCSALLFGCHNPLTKTISKHYSRCSDLCQSVVNKKIIKHNYYTTIVLKSYFISL